MTAQPGSLWLRAAMLGAAFLLAMPLTAPAADSSSAREVPPQEAGTDKSSDSQTEDSSALKDAMAGRARGADRSEDPLEIRSAKAAKDDDKNAADDESEAAPDSGEQAEDGSAVAGDSGKNEPSEWWRRGKFEGELQYRYGELHKYIHDEGEKADSADRDLSLHLGYSVEAARGWDLHLALNSARDGRPLSSYVPLDGLEDESWLALNEYWSETQTALGANGRLSSRIGRFSYPFELSQMLYDNDLRLPSVYLQYSHERPVPEPQKDEDGEELPPCPQLGLQRWEFSLYGADLVSGRLPEGALVTESDGPARLGSIRLDTRWQLNSDARLNAAVSYHDFGNVDSLGYRVAAGDWRIGGNAGKGETTNYSAVTGALASDFRLLDLHLSTQWGKDTHWPLVIELEAVRNLGVRDDGKGEDSGWFAGLTLGNRERLDSIQVGLSRAHIETDAVLAAVNRGEYGTNTENTRLQLRCKPSFLQCGDVEGDLRAAMTWGNDLNPAGPSGPFDKRLTQFYLTFSW